MIENHNRAVAVVVNSGDSNGYGVVVNLGRNGIPVFSVDSNPENITFFSKYAKKVICPDYEISELEFIEFLLTLGMGLTPKPVLFVTGDLQLLAVLRHREKLEQYYHMPMASIDVVEKLVDKVLFYNILDEYKIPHARTYAPERLAEVERLSSKLEYPYIIKPVQSKFFSKKFGNKCLEVNTKEELCKVYEKVAREEDQIIIQKQLAGTERYLVYTYFDQDSKPLAVCCYKKERINPIDYGNACMCKIAWEPEAIQLCFHVLKKIRYRGLAEAEIQRDKNDGQLKLVEINARSTTEVKLSAKFGFNMEYIAYRDILKQGVCLAPLKRHELKWIDILSDFMSVFSPEGYLANGKITLGEWINSLRGDRSYAFWVREDPLPFIMILIRFFKTYGLKKKNFYKIYEIIRISIYKRIFKIDTKNKKASLAGGNIPEQWRLEKANSNFIKYKDSWQRLAKETLGLNHPLIDVDYVEPLIKYFANDNLMLAIKGNHGEGGMVLLEKKKFGNWQCFLPGTGPFSFALIKDTGETPASELILSLLKDLPGYALFLGFNKLDPDFLTVNTGRNENYTDKIDYMKTISIPVDKTFDAYWKDRSKNLKRNIIKKLNRIKKNEIELEFRELRTSAEMESGVSAYGVLETKGWKGKENSAVNIDNHRGQFYVEMLKRFAHRGQACIYQLIFNNQVVASALTICGGDMIVILKITYDEDVKEYSPGMVMYYELHKKLFSTKEVKRIEYYGKATQRMRQWAVNIRTIYHLNFYRTPLVKQSIHMVKKLNKHRL